MTGTLGLELILRGLVASRIHSYITLGESYVKAYPIASGGR